MITDADMMELTSFTANAIFIRIKVMGVRLENYELKLAIFPLAFPHKRLNLVLIFMINLWLIPDFIKKYD